MIDVLEVSNQIGGRHKVAEPFLPGGIVSKGGSANEAYVTFDGVRIPVAGLTWDDYRAVGTIDSPLKLLPGTFEQKVQEAAREQFKKRELVTSQKLYDMLVSAYSQEAVDNLNIAFKVPEPVVPLSQTLEEAKKKSKDGLINLATIKPQREIDIKNLKARLNAGEFVIPAKLEAIKEWKYD